MVIDFSECEIREPKGKELCRLYKVLREIFPGDRILYETLIEQEQDKDGSPPARG